ncbi:B-4DMT family transporter [Prauserella sp. PE36]|uniref:B-4DMT family transporter n=1 Tax=Prauserella sp. PE36 TaxID=1504709 RepID=UPI0018F33FC7
MPSWVVRGLGMAVLHAAATVALAKIAVFQPTESTTVTAVVLALLVGAAALWSALDAWLGLVDAGRTWFIAALVAGPVAGVLNVVGRAAFVDQTGVGELGSALTGGAAFTALLVLVPAGLGLLVGGKLHTTREDAGADSGPDSDAGTAEEPAPRPRPQPRKPKVGPAG